MRGGWRTIWVTTTLALLTWTLVAESASAGPASDRFQSFAELASRHREGKDFTVTAEDRKAEGAVFAIHGGMIEIETAELARALAGTDLNLYVFEANVPGLHLTSHRFDDPRAIGLAERSLRCLSVHGYAEERTSEPEACIGGANAELRQKVEATVKEMGIRTEQPCREFPGTHVRNVVNLCPKGGVQLELSKAFRRKLAEDSKLRAEWVRRLRASIQP